MSLYKCCAHSISPINVNFKLKCSMLNSQCYRDEPTTILHSHCPAVLYHSVKLRIWIYLCHSQRLGAKIDILNLQNVTLHTFLQHSTCGSLGRSELVTSNLNPCQVGAWRRPEISGENYRDYQTFFRAVTFSWSGLHPGPGYCSSKYWY